MNTKNNHLQTAHHNFLSPVVQPIFLIVQLCDQYLTHLVVKVIGEIVSKNLLKGKVTDIHCLPFACRSSHLILEDTQLDQAWFLLGISMLAVSNHFLVSCVLGNGFQENLHHNFPGHQGKADHSSPDTLSFLPWRCVWHLALFLSSGTSHSHQDLSKTR